jgi:hypothetical protein
MTPEQEKELIESIKSIDYTLKYFGMMAQVLTHKVTGTMVNPPPVELRKGPLFPNK